MRDGKASKEVDENGKLHHGFKLDLEDFSMKSDVHNSSEVNLFSNFSCFHQTIEVWCLSNAIKKLINDKYFPFHVINSCRVREHPRRKKRMNLKLIRHRHYRFKSCLLSYHQFRLFLLNFFNFREWKLNDNWNISFVYANDDEKRFFPDFALSFFVFFPSWVWMHRNTLIKLLWIAFFSSVVFCCHLNFGKSLLFTVAWIENNPILLVMGNRSGIMEMNAFKAREFSKDDGNKRALWHGRREQQREEQTSSLSLQLTEMSKEKSLD